MEIETITRKWGNSIAVIIPSRIVEQEKIKEDQRVIITLEKKTACRRTLGLWKGSF